MRNTIALTALLFAPAVFADTPEKAMPEALESVKAAKSLGERESARLRLCLNSRNGLSRAYQAKVMSAVARYPVSVVAKLQAIVEELRRSLSAAEREQLKDALAAGWGKKIAQTMTPRYAAVATAHRTGFCATGKYVSLSIGLDENEPHVQPGICRNQPDQFHDDIWVTDPNEIVTVYWREVSGKVIATACRGKYEVETYYGENSRRWLTSRRLVEPSCVSGDMLGGEVPVPQPVDAVMTDAAAGTPGLPTWTEYLKANLDAEATQHCPELLAGL